MHVFGTIATSSVLRYCVITRHEGNAYNTMLNKNTLGVKKVWGQSEATCKKAGATKSFDISWGQEVSYFIKKLLTPWMKYNSL